MRIRNYRQKDLLTLAHLQELAAQHDGTESCNESDFVAWLQDGEQSANTFVITDDDDELNAWGPAGTLEGIDGEVVGYTSIQLHQDQQGYHVLCQGTVHPQFRRQHAGRVLLVGALNRARMLAEEFEFEAEQEGIPVYFEAYLPASDPGSEGLAARCEMRAVEEPAPPGMRLYRREL
ncbi:MAG TPA: GNAT family N-acetyltransferase [Ktedonobacteraceae bacterium]|nr:GNAT family N-acetyltransferase [Ktedonobacteraceae bacterium]